MKKARIYTFGDSITYGAWDSQGGWCDRLKRKLHQLKINPDYDVKFQMLNLGIGGENSRALLKRFEAELISRHREDWPAVIIIATGANNTRFSETDPNPALSIEEFQKNLDDLIAIGKKYTSKLLFIGMAPVKNELQTFKKSLLSNDLLKKYDETLSSIARANNISKVELWEKLKKATQQIYSVDEVHPNDDGHQMIANLVWIELEKILFEKE